MPRQYRLHLLAAAAYALLAFLILHGILLRSGTHVAGFDYFNYNWNFWWLRHALSSGLNVYINDYVMAPNTVNLGYHALTAFWYPLWALLEPLIGTLHAVNVIIFVGCFLNGYVLFVFLRREGVTPGLALLGGVLLQASPVSRYFYYNTHLNLMDWFWLPAHLLLWGQIVRAGRAGRWQAALLWGAAQGVALWALGHTDLQFPIFTAFVLVPYGLWTLWQVIRDGKHSPQRGRDEILPPLHRERGAGGEVPPLTQRLGVIAAGGATALVVALALLWFAGPLPYMARFAGTLAPGTAEDRPGIPFPRGYLSVDPVWWEWNVPTLGGAVTVFVLSALLAGWWYRRALRGQGGRWFWFVVMLPPLLLSMGPTLTLLGADIPMPFRALHSLTNGMFRMPWRLAPIFVIAGVIFAAKTWTYISAARPVSRRRDGIYPVPTYQHNGQGVRLILAAALLLIVLDVRLYQTPPITDNFRPERLTQIEPPLPSYAFYDEIGAETGDFVVLEVPTGAATGEVILGDPRATQLQFYAIRHQKRTLNGFISRAPIDFFWSIQTEDPLLSWLGQRRFLEPELVEPRLRQIIDEWPVGYVVVHQDMIGRATVTPQEIVGYLNSVGDLLCPVWVERDAVVYRSASHPLPCPPRTPPEAEPGVYQIDLGSSGDERYIGWGWHWSEDVGVTWRWAGEYPQALLYVDLPPGDYTVSLAAQAFHEARTLTVLAGDTALGDPVTVAPGSLQTFTFSLPAALVGQGQHITLTLAYDAVVVPQEIGQSADPRRLSIAVDWLRFERETP